MAIEIESSSDTVEQVTEALAKSIEIDEAPAATEEEEKPVVKPPRAKEEPAEEEPAAETEEEEPTEEEAVVEEEKPKKPAPKHVPLSRLNEEIRKRKAAERRAEAAEASEEPAPEVKPGVDTKPQTYCGRTKPTIAEFQADPEKYPDPYASHADAVGEWYADERDAKREFESRATAAAKAREEETALFKSTLPKTLERRPDYHDIVTGSDVRIHAEIERFVYESEIGPDMLLYFVENPDEAEKLNGMRTRSRAVAMLELEEKLKEEIGVEEPEAEEKPAAKKIVPPLKKEVSKAPLPPSRLKPAGPGPKTLQELAGPVDKVGVDLDFNPAYEKAVKAKRGT